MPLRRRVLEVARRDGHEFGLVAAALGLGCLGHFIVRDELCPALVGGDLGQRRGERGLAVVDVTDFFFHAEDGIRVHCVTGVQTCALPISSSPSGKYGTTLMRPSKAGLNAFSRSGRSASAKPFESGAVSGSAHSFMIVSVPTFEVRMMIEIGRASWRERV